MSAYIEKEKIVKYLKERNVLRRVSICSNNRNVKDNDPTVREIGAMLQRINNGDFDWHGESE